MSADSTPPTDPDAPPAPDASPAAPASPSPGGEDEERADFIRAIVQRDLEEGRHETVVTRFPPEPNGYLHVGHASSICLNFGVAEENGGVTNLRFDDTNPTTEDVRYVEAIQEDIRWLGFDWGDRLFHASDWFETLYGFAEALIRKGKAYVDSLSEEEIREHRGTVTETGRRSRWAERSVEENLDLFRRMRAGEFGDGEHVLRARIDMASPNMVMRDPVLYRIRHAHHYRTGDAWCIYPLYDFAHGLSDAIEGVTHSICTLEFENNRELYDWLLDEVGFEEPRPHQYEFSRRNLEHTVMSKRKLLRLVNEGHVGGWDDPRMPTLAGLRRRGVPPSALRSFADLVGVTRSENRVDVEKLEFAIRDDLNPVAPRVMAVLDPLRVVIENWPEGETEWLEASYFPRDVDREGSRKVPFSRVLYVERDDFMEDPPEDFYRLAPGREVRLRYGYLVQCREVVRSGETGEVVELRCTYDPDTRGGSAPDGRRVRGTLHWVSAEHALPAEVRLWDRLFLSPDPESPPPGVPEEDYDFREDLNPGSLVVRSDARVEPSVADDDPSTRYQFERQGYFWRDPVDSTPERPVFNRIVSLRDTWGRKREAAEGASAEAGGEARAEVARGAGEDSGSGGGAPRSLQEARETALARGGELRERFLRYTESWGLDAEQGELLTRAVPTATFFEDAVAAHDDPPEVARWVVNELPRELDGRDVDALPFGGGAFGRLVALVAEGTVSANAARTVLARMAREGGEPEAIVDEEGLRQISDRAALEPVVDRILEAHPGKVEAYRGGKTGLAGFFVGQALRVTEGRGDPRLVKAIVEEKLGEG